jgi:imidazolonepropionase-like amidohydrolase
MSTIPQVVITDGRITAVGKAGDAIPAGAKVVDLPGATLLPGLIDMHVHLDSVAEIGGYNGLQYSDAFWSVVQTANAKRTLEAGFTTVRNVGSEQFDDVGLREAIDEGYVPGPRIVTATYAIGATGGHCDSTFFPPSMDQKSPYNVDSPDEGRKVVRDAEEVRRAGDQDLRHRRRVLARRRAGAAAADPGRDAGHRRRGPHGRPEGRRPRPRRAGDQGRHPGRRRHHRARQPGRRRGDQAGGPEGRLLLDGHLQHRLHPGRGRPKNGVLEDNLRKDRDIGEMQRENFRKALKAGVKMIYGTDAGVYPHGTNAKQFAVMVRYGATPLQAIQAATITAAQALGQEKDVGQVAVGRYGDLIAVTGDPLSDVTTLEKPVFVMKGGAVVKRP